MAAITKKERIAKAMLLRYSYAHLLYRMRNKNVPDETKDMIAVRIVRADMISKNGINVHIGDKTETHVTNTTIMPATREELDRAIAGTISRIDEIRRLSHSGNGKA